MVYSKFTKKLLGSLSQLALTQHKVGTQNFYVPSDYLSIFTTLQHTLFIKYQSYSTYVSQHCLKPYKEAPPCITGLKAAELLT